MSTALGAEATAAHSPETVRQPRKVHWFIVPVVLSLLLGGATAWVSLQQSLWIDELHTAWSSSGSWQQIVPRAAVGNQTPIYFAWQWWLGRTFGQSEVCWRATSLVAWFASLCLLTLVIRRLVARTSQHGLWWLVCLAALDRQQIFFATEARPYMLMSLVLLLGWLALAQWLSLIANENQAKDAKRGLEARLVWTAWLACSSLTIWLQPTAVLFVASQLAWATWQGTVSSWIFQRHGRRWRTLLDIIIGVCVLTALIWPMRYVLEPAWQGRQAWTAFAADLRWQNVLKQLPILLVAIPGALAWTFHFYLRFKGNLPHRDPNVAEEQRAGMFLVAWLLPLVAVLVLTAAGIAPLMHARYLFAATLPMILWIAMLLSRLPGSRWVSVIALGLVVVQAVQQGSAAFWMAGQLPGLVRGESWREAISHIQRDASKGDRPVEIYCACNLIEGARSNYAAGNPLREEYLSLPLRTLYPIPDRTTIVSLLNDPRSWPTVISGSSKAMSTRWLLVRTSQAGLAKRLQLSGLRPLEQFDFGGVQLVRF